jgi:hypothetical protein
MLYTVKKRLPISPSPAGMSQTKLSLVSDILAGDGKIGNIFLQCTCWRHIRISLVSDIPTGDGKIGTLFLQCACWRHIRISWLPPGLLHYPPFIPSFYLLKQPFFFHPLHNTSYNIRFLLLEEPPSCRSLVLCIQDGLHISYPDPIFHDIPYPAPDLILKTYINVLRLRPMLCVGPRIFLTVREQWIYSLYSAICH